MSRPPGSQNTQNLISESRVVHVSLPCTLHGQFIYMLLRHRRTTSVGKKESSRNRPVSSTSFLSFSSSPHLHLLFLYSHSPLSRSPLFTFTSHSLFSLLFSFSLLILILILSSLLPSLHLIYPFSSTSLYLFFFSPSLLTSSHSHHNSSHQTMPQWLRRRLMLLVSGLECW